MAIDTDSIASPVGGDHLVPNAPGRPGAGGDRGSWRRIALLTGAGFVVLLLVAGVVRATGGGGSDGPSRWDPRLGDLPQTVARLRGLSFTHPVPVRFLPAEKFTEQDAVAGGKVTRSERRQVEQLTRGLRALGLVSGKVDLVEAVRTSQRSRVLAYYDAKRTKVVVRGAGHVLDAPHRVVLAHELTHVLQDQHFDLSGLEDRVRKDTSQSSDALRAVVEGDAERIEARYRRRLSASDQRAYQRWEESSTGAADRATADVPEIVSVSEGAPYLYGPSVLQVVTADGGNGAVDRVFEHGVFTQTIFIEPTASLTEPAPKPLAAPTLARSERRIGKPAELGAFDLYLLLASRIDPGSALATSIRWRGGRMVNLRDHAGRVCVRADVAGTSTRATEAIASDLGQWAARLPPDMATVHRRGRVVEIRSCDPGAGGTLAPPDEAIHRATNVLGAHNQIEAGLVRDLTAQGLSLQVARCASLALVRSPELSKLFALPEDQVSSEDVGNAISAAAPAVRSACGL